LSLATAQSGVGDAAGDVLTSIEKVIGSGYADSLWGSSGNETLIGGAGNDTLYGSAGADTLNGGTATGAAAGTDTVDYSASSAAVNVNLALPTAQSGGDAQGDILSNISNLVGSAFADTLTGTSAANVLSGGKGDDAIVGGGGADTLIGGDGKDLLTGGSGVETFDLATDNTSLAGDKAQSGVTGATSGGGDTFIVNAANLSSIDSNTLIQGTSAALDTLQIMGTTGVTIDLTTLNSTALTSIASINTLDVSKDNAATAVKLNLATIQGLVDVSSGIPTLTIKLGTGDTIDFQNETHVSFKDDVARTIKIYDSVNGNLNPLAQINF
jgi:Ca2+-binding RTX toxin-like protein